MLQETFLQASSVCAKCVNKGKPVVAKLLNYDRANRKCVERGRAEGERNCVFRWKQTERLAPHKGLLPDARQMAVQEGGEL